MYAAHIRQGREHSEMNGDYYLQLAHKVVENLKGYDMIHGTFFRRGYDTEQEFNVLASAIEAAEIQLKKDDSENKEQVKIEPRTKARG